MALEPDFSLLHKAVVKLFYDFGNQNSDGKAAHPKKFRQRDGGRTA